jgi:hypothetical protein
MSTWAAKDWIILGLAVGFGVCGTVYLFMPNHDNTAYGIWAGIFGTLIGFLKLADMWDDKFADK